MSPIGPRPAALLGLLVTWLMTSGCRRDDAEIFPPYDVSLESSVTSAPERSLAPVFLEARHRYAPESYRWRQTDGPRVPLLSLDADRARVDLSSFEVALDVALTFEIEGVLGQTIARDRVTLEVRTLDTLNALGDWEQIGGSDRAAALFEYDGVPWLIRATGARLAVAPVANPDRAARLTLPGFVHDLVITHFDGRRFALAALGREGIASIDLTDPASPSRHRVLSIHYRREGITFADGGGHLVRDHGIESGHARLVALATDKASVWMATSDFGLHRTALAHLLGEPGPRTEADGTLTIVSERSTLAFAGERPWGGPTDLALSGDRLFATLGELGLGIFEADSLRPVGRYNLYTDATVTEDWAIDLVVADAVQPGFLDPETGMPTPEQVRFEIQEVWKGGTEAPTPWADFEGQGRYYYTARAVTVNDWPDRSIAYLAYGLGGLIAVDVTGYRSAGPGSTFLEGRYLGGAPGVPAHGPKKPTGEQGSSLLARHGVERLAEAGIQSVFIHGDDAYFSDHFGGLMVVSGAARPEVSWRGSEAPYDNDDPTIGDGVLGDHWPPWEFITSFDMSPSDPDDEESLPVWIFESPCRLATGELGGHASRLLALSTFDAEQPGAPDLYQSVSAGGSILVDVVDLTAPEMTDRYTVITRLPTTDEIGASTIGPIEFSIGHAAGVTASRRHLYLADGPHGISAWRIADDSGAPLDPPRLVANTRQGEDEPGDFTANHAHQAIYDAEAPQVWAACRTAGLRRLDVSHVESGAGSPGAPWLISLSAPDCFEHKSEEIPRPGIPHQDNARDVAFGADGLAFVADGRNGLTIYDTTKDPTVPESGYLVANLGAGGEKPLLGVAGGLALAESAERRFALVACGPFGLGVVDVTRPTDPLLIKVFEPVNVASSTDQDEEEGHLGTADGVSIDVVAKDGLVWLSYDASGVYCFALEDLIAPLPEGVDPTRLWSFEAGRLVFDHRPRALSVLRLEEQLPEAPIGGAAGLLLAPPPTTGLLWVAYGEAGVAWVDWSLARAPVLLALIPTNADAQSICTSQGRIYVADSEGGLAVFN